MQITSRTTITPRELKWMLDAGEPVVVVDVREPAEFKDWHVPGSLNVPLGDILAGAGVAAAPGAAVVTVCAHGARSEAAREALASRGVDAVSMAGGMVAWNGVYDVVAVPSAKAEVLQFRRVGKGCLSYMVVSAGEALVVDPTVDVHEYVEAAEDRGARIVRVVDTHAHADHASGSRTLASATGAEYHAPDEVGPEVPHASVTEGEPIPVGRVALEPVATPGHTAGSFSYRLGDLLLTGDTLFVESVGRPDLGQDPRPNAEVLHRTLHEKVLTHPGATRVLPGHYGDAVTIERGIPVSATLAELSRTVRALSFTKDEFVEWVARNALPKPANFEAIKQLNKGRVTVDDLDDLRELEAGPNRCAVSG